MKHHHNIEYEINDPEWEALSHEEKNRRLFEHQKRTLELFLKSGAISKEQHDKSLRDLMEKMNTKDDGDKTGC